MWTNSIGNGTVKRRGGINCCTPLSRLTRFTGQIGVAAVKPFSNASQHLPISFRKEADYLIKKMGQCSSEVARLAPAARMTTFYTFKHVRRCSSRFFETNNLRIEKRHAGT